ncbi:MAG: hypothetical protein JXA09_03525 [Anaerolineae bacterium]|nr:hypothetical protein [Anaerolineae bacterium]
MAEQQQPVINLEWIDEEVRRYRTELIAAQQRINGQHDEIQDLHRHIEDLEGRLAGQQTQLNRITVLERALAQYKEEIRLLVEQQAEAYQQDRREGARIKLIEQDNVNRAINELRKALAGIPRLEEELELRAAEERRLNEAQLAVRQRTMELEKRLDTDLRPIPYMQDQRARDARHIAQLQEQTAAVVKAVDGLVNRTLVVEEIAQRNRQNVEDLVTIRSELQGEQRRFLEQMQLGDQERTRRISEWADAEEAREARMKAFADQMRVATEQSQRIKAALASLESIGERLQREQHEMSELQRLSEERQRAKMDEWESETEKRWQREKLLWEQQWRDHDRRNAEVLERIGVVEGRSEHNGEQIGYLWELLVDDLRLQAEMAQNRAIKLGEQIESRRKRNRS